MGLREDSLFLCLRIPKSGSSSLGRALVHALKDARHFYLPDTLELDGRLSRFQHLRFRRAQIRNLVANYRTPSLEHAFARIDAEVTPGDLLSGGHIDFPTVRCRLKQRVKIVTIFRDPYARCRSEYHYARQNQLKKRPLARLDSNVVPQIAARYDFDGYLDFLLDHREVYGDIACAYLGLSAGDDIASFFAENVFHAGVLEQSTQFADSLAEKLGRPIVFPHLNKSESEQHVALGARARRKIESLYARDFDVYEWQLAQHKNREPRIRVPPHKGDAGFVLRSSASNFVSGERGILIGNGLVRPNVY
jgi:sulfotransferase family protein